MKHKKRYFAIHMLILFPLLAGCWDRTELNDLAIWLASGWDLGKDGEPVKLSGQIIIPSQLNTSSSQPATGGNESFFVISDTGINGGESLQHMQQKLSRKAFFGQRRVIFIGEKFAERGISKRMDMNTTSSNVSLRTDIFIIKDGSAEEALTIPYPLENIPAVATVKEHERLGGRGTTAFKTLIIAINSEGIRPTIPVLQMTKLGKSTGVSPNHVLQMAGVGVFDKDLKLKGYLTMDENRSQLWVMGLLKELAISTAIEDGEGDVTFVLNKIKSKVTPTIDKQNNVRFNIELTGKGMIEENNTKIDLDDKKEIDKLIHYLEKHAEKKVLHTIQKVQKEFEADIFGFGDRIYRKHPHKWHELKKDWDAIFSKAEVTLSVKLDITHKGMTNYSPFQKNRGAKQ